MKWRKKIWRHGDVRVRSWFAILPVAVIDGDYSETRWLRRVTVLQKFYKPLYPFGVSWWDNEEFVEEFVDE